MKRQPSLLDSWSVLRKKKCPREEVVLLSNDEAEDEAESRLQMQVTNEDLLIEIPMEAPGNHGLISVKEEVACLKTESDHDFVLAEESQNGLVANSTPTESDFCTTIYIKYSYVCMYVCMQLSL